MIPIPIHDHKTKQNKNLKITLVPKKPSRNNKDAKKQKQK